MVANVWSLHMAQYMGNYKYMKSEFFLLLLFNQVKIISLAKFDKYDT